MVLSAERRSGYCTDILCLYENHGVFLYFLRNRRGFVGSMLQHGKYDRANAYNTRQYVFTSYACNRVYFSQNAIYAVCCMDICDLMDYLRHMFLYSVYYQTSKVFFLHFRKHFITIEYGFF